MFKVYNVKFKIKNIKNNTVHTAKFFYNQNNFNK